MTLAGPSTGKIILKDGLFGTDPTLWLTPGTVPYKPVVRSAPLKRWPMRHSTIPVLFGSSLESGLYVEADSDLITFGIDLLGGAFFLLTRYEEVAAPSYDGHGRFPASGSVLFREDLLRRPLVNEYVELLWLALKTLWPQLQRPGRRYSVCPTHDVDRPFCVYGKPLTQVARQLMGDIFRRREPMLALKRLGSKLAVRDQGPGADLCYNFDWIMQESERRGLRSTFYFLRRTDDPRDSDYEFDDAPISSLLRNIHRRGHEVGLHPSYHTFRSAERIGEELASLRIAAEKAGVIQSSWGSRQHFLRWEASTTWQALSDAGLEYDSTAGFADAAGFRCGTCYDFPVFNLRKRQALPLRERPLIAMEESLLAGAYEGLSHEQALEALQMLADECRYYDGEFVLLWHNSRMLTVRDKRTYLSTLDSVVPGG